MNYKDLILKSNSMKKVAFVPAETKTAGAMPPSPMDPAMMGGQPPMDPSMMGGQPPMDPAMMGGQPPMDPAMMGGQPPMDPAMMGGQPPMPPTPPQDPMNELVSIVTSMSEDLSRFDKENESMKAQMEDIKAANSELKAKLDFLLSILNKG